MNRLTRIEVTTAGVAVALLTASTQAQNLDGLTWTEQKCVLYQGAWDAATSGPGLDGLSPEFLERNDTFVTLGCTIQGNVCPRSDEELNLANMLTLMTMSEGMASTFAPFSCRDDAE